MCVLLAYSCVTYTRQLFFFMIMTHCSGYITSTHRCGRECEVGGGTYALNHSMKFSPFIMRIESGHFYKQYLILTKSVFT